MQSTVQIIRCSPSLPSPLCSCGRAGMYVHRCRPIKWLLSAAQHTALLGQFSRTSLTEGVNEKLLWHPDSTRVAVKVRHVHDDWLTSGRQARDSFMSIRLIGTLDLL